MTQRKLYKLTNPKAQVPMPDRGNRLFSKGGERINADLPFYANMIADGDIALAPKSADKDDSDKKK